MWLVFYWSRYLVRVSLVGLCWCIYLAKFVGVYIYINLLRMFGLRWQNI